LKLVDQYFTLAAILEFSVSRVAPLCAICQIMRISVWTEKYLWTSTIEATYEVILNKFYLAAILENGGLQNSAIQLPSYTFLLMNFYASKDIWHTSPSLKLPQDQVCSWAKPKTRFLATIFSAILLDSRVFITQMQMRYEPKWFLMLYENVLTLSYEKL